MNLKAWRPRFNQMLVGAAVTALVPAMASGGEATCNPPCTVTECTTLSVCNTSIGQCVVTNKPDSTPCTDTDGNACTTAGCEAGQCVQTHVTTTCPPDTNECTDDLGCNPATGQCEHPSKPDSTPCTDTDGNLCTIAGCDAGQCVQTHMTTVCPPDNNECTDDLACNPATGLCPHPSVPDSTPCADTDGNACTMAGCEAGQCVQTHMTTVCPPDNNECTEDLCNPATGLCEHLPVPDFTLCDSSAGVCVGGTCCLSGCPPTPTATPTTTPTPITTPTATPTNTPVPNGGECAASGQCQSGNCVDATCCDRPCQGPLERCNLAGRAGTCSSTAAGVPATSERGLIVASMLLAGVAALAIARRRRAPRQ